MGTATRFLGVFSLVTICLFCTFIYLLVNVDPEIKSRPIPGQRPSLGEESGEISENAPEIELKEKPDEHTEKNENGPEENPEGSEEQRIRKLRNLKKPCRRSNVFIRPYLRARTKLNDSARGFTTDSSFISKWCARDSYLMTSSLIKGYSTEKTMYHKSKSEIPNETLQTDVDEEDDSNDIMDDEYYTDATKDIKLLFIQDVLNEVKKFIRKHKIKERDIEFQAKDFSKEILNLTNKTTTNKYDKSLDIENVKEILVKESLLKISKEQERISCTLNDIKNMLFKLTGRKENCNKTNNKVAESVKRKNKIRKILIPRQLNILGSNEIVLSGLNVTREHPCNQSLKHTSTIITNDSFTNGVQNNNITDNYLDNTMFPLKTKDSSSQVCNQIEIVRDEKTRVTKVSMRDTNLTDNFTKITNTISNLTGERNAVYSFIDTSFTTICTEPILMLNKLIEPFESRNKTSFISNSNNMTMRNPKEQDQITTKQKEMPDEQRNQSKQIDGQRVKFIINNNEDAEFINTTQHKSTERTHIFNLFKTVLSSALLVNRENIIDLDFTGVKFVKKQSEYQNLSDEISSKSIRCDTTRNVVTQPNTFTVGHLTDFSYYNRPTEDTSRGPNTIYDLKIRNRYKTSRVKFIRKSNP